VTNVNTMTWRSTLCIAFLAARLSYASSIEIERDLVGNRFRLNVDYQPNTLLTLETSADTIQWTIIGVFHHALYSYVDIGAAKLSQRYYRVKSASGLGTNSWKNQLVLPDDVFCAVNRNNQDIGWVKFAIVLSEPDRVYFQDCNKYRYHYDFAAKELDRFKGMNHQAFDAVSLYRTNQEVVLGTILFPIRPYANTSRLFVHECAVQFVGSEPYTPEEISRWFNWVKSSIYAADGIRTYYLPTLEQRDSSIQQEKELEALGIPIMSIERWTQASTCYSTGWALGHLKYLASSDVKAAFTDGRLGSEDILLTDNIPLDMPLVAGLIVLNPATPNSHTAILYTSLGIPFIYLSTESDRVRVQGLAGHKVVLRATQVQSAFEIKVLDVENALAPELESEILGLKQNRKINYLPKQFYGAVS
jgi:hypothetical protein